VGRTSDVRGANMTEPVGRTSDVRGANMTEPVGRTSDVRELAYLQDDRAVQRRDQESADRERLERERLERERLERERLERERLEREQSRTQKRQEGFVSTSKTTMPSDPEQIKAVLIYAIDQYGIDKDANKLLEVLNAAPSEFLKTLPPDERAKVPNKVWEDLRMRKSAHSTSAHAKPPLARGWHGGSSTPNVA
jgi:hypothetical protein